MERGVTTVCTGNAVTGTSVTRRLDRHAQGGARVQVPRGRQRSLLLQRARRMCSCLAAAVFRACLAVSPRRRQNDSEVPVLAPACAAANDGVEREGAVLLCTGLAYARLRDTWMPARAAATDGVEREGAVRPRTVSARPVAPSAGSPRARRRPGRLATTLKYMARRP